MRNGITVTREVARLRTARDNPEQTSQRIRLVMESLRCDLLVARQQCEGNHHPPFPSKFVFISLVLSRSVWLVDIRAHNKSLLDEIDGERQRLCDVEVEKHDTVLENQELHRCLETAQSSLSKLTKKEAALIEECDKPKRAIVRSEGEQKDEK